MSRMESSRHSHLLDRFIDEMSSVVDSKYGQRRYRKLPISLALKHDLGNRILSNTSLIKEILTNGESKPKWNQRISEELSKYEREFKLSFVRWFRYTIIDIIRYIVYAIRFKSCQSFDYCIVITNKKFYSYSKPIADQLKSRGHRTGYLFWNPSDASNLALQDDQVISFRLSFPQIFNPLYRAFRPWCLMEDRAVGCIAQLKSSRVMLVEGCLLEHHMLGHSLSSISGFVACLQWGYFGKSATKMGWRNMPYTKFLAWGDFFKNEFQPYNPQLPISLVGHSSLKYHESNAGANVILFAMQRTMEQHITPRELKIFIQLAIDFARQRSDYEVRIRSHPDFSIPLEWRTGASSNIIWHDYKDYSLDESLSGARYCVSISSTVGVESLCYLAYPIYVKVNDLPLQLHEAMGKLSDQSHVFMPEDLERGITHLDLHYDRRKLVALRDHFFYQIGKNAIENTVKEL